MSGLTADRNTASQRADVISVPVAASTKIFAGSLVAANSTGYAVPGSTATTLTYLGRADEFIDNSAGANGAVSIRVRRRDAFYFDNSGTDPVTQSDLGKACYIVDDHTVSATSGTNTQSKAGVVVGLDANGVWVE